MRRIPNFSRYSVDEDGHIYSTNYKNSGKTKELSPAVSPDGYLKTMLLGDDGKYHSVTVHLMVCTAFFGEKPKGMEINHKNGIKTDNRICNLEYCTRSVNLLHAFRLGLEKPLRGESNPCAKLTWDNVREIRAYVKSSNKRFYGRKELAKRFGVSESHIKDIVSGRRGVWKESV